MARRGGGVCWVGLLIATSVALHCAGRGPLALPPADRLGDWLRQTDPVVVSFALVRALALALAAYAAAVTAAGTVARSLGAVRLAAVVDRLTLPVLRRLFAVSLSMGVAATTTAVATPLPAMAAEGTGDPAAAGPPPTLKMHRLPDGSSTPIHPAPQEAPPAASEHEESHGGPAPAHWRVEPGQCFWSIAESVLSRAWGRAPSDAEIVPYWQRLVEANRGALADPRNADLIFPGQLFVIPPAPLVP